MTDIRSRLPMRRSPLLALFVLAGLAPVPTMAAPKPVDTSFSFTSEAGDYIGQGQTRRFTNADSAISLSGTGSILTLSVTQGSDWWYVNFNAPAGDRFRPGIYPRAERAGFETGRSPGLDVYGDGRGCNMVWGTYVIDQVAYDGNGAVAMLDASYVQRCEGPTAPKMRGLVHYVAPPLSFAYASDPGDYIGQGNSASYDGSTTLFSLMGTTSRLIYSVSGDRDEWTATISAPTGQVLKPGTYDTTTSGSATTAGLDFFGDGRGCASTGTLTITGITSDKSGNVTSLGASFVQHCDGNAPALHGTIRQHNN